MLWLVSVIVLALDQLAKFFALRYLSYGSSLPLIKNIFHLTLVKNYGMAFGLFPGAGFVFIFITIVFIFLISRQLWLGRGRGLGAGCILGLYLVLGGAVGNLCDRLRWGYVLDFLDFRVWPVFNLADSCITVGAVILCIQCFLRSGRSPSTPMGFSWL